MKKIFIVLLLLLALSLSAQTNKTSIAVVPFQSENLAADEISIISDVFEAHLVQTKKFTVIERNRIDKVVSEQKLAIILHKKVDSS